MGRRRERNRRREKGEPVVGQCRERSGSERKDPEGPGRLVEGHGRIGKERDSIEGVKDRGKAELETCPGVYKRARI